MKKISKKITSIICCAVLTVLFIASNTSNASAAIVNQKISGTIDASNILITSKPKFVLHTYDAKGKELNSYDMSVKTVKKAGIPQSYTISTSKLLNDKKVKKISVEVSCYDNMKKYYNKSSLKKNVGKTYTLRLNNKFVTYLN